MSIQVVAVGIISNKQTNRFWVCFRGNREEICLQIGCCVGEANKGMSLGFGLEELGGTACFVEGIKNVV